jgi:predicted Zn-ribbon and HTH transcriptional regulator
MNYLQVQGSPIYHAQREGKHITTLCGIEPDVPFPTLIGFSVLPQDARTCQTCMQVEADALVALGDRRLDTAPPAGYTLPQEGTRVPIEQPPEVIETSMSAIDTFGRCRRKYLYQEVLGWQPRSATWAMVIGTAFHSALAAGYNAVREYDVHFIHRTEDRSNNTRALAFIEAAVKTATSVEFDRDGKKLGLTIGDYELLEDMVRYWFEKVGEADLARIEEIMFVEEPLYVQIGPYLIRCTVDLGFRYIGQPELTLKDHKTGDPEESKAWTLFDTQTSTYYVAATGRYEVSRFQHSFSDRSVPPGYGHRSLDTETGQKRNKKTLENMCRQERYVADASTDPECVTVLSKHQLAAYTEELVEIIQEIDHAKETGRWTRTKLKVGPMACSKCPYYGPCKSERDGNARMSNELASTMYVIRGSEEWHALQSGNLELEVKD